MTADPMATRIAAQTAARTMAQTGTQAAPHLRDRPAEQVADPLVNPLADPFADPRTSAALPGRGPSNAPGNRPPQTVRLENDGLIIEFCDDVPPDRLRGRGRGAEPVTTAGQTWLHLRIRSDGLLAHAVLQVANLALGRFVRNLDELIRLGNGEASLTGTSRYPSALRFDAEAGQTRMTLLACPPLTTPVRVVIEALELRDADVHAIRRWAAGHRAD